jgi:hypothetical protein
MFMVGALRSCTFTKIVLSGSKSPPKEGNCALVHKVDFPNIEHTIMVRGVK